MEVVMRTGAIRRAKLQSNHHHQQSNTQFFLQAGCTSCRPTNSVKALKEKVSHPIELFTPNSPGGLQLCLWPLKASSYLGRGLPNRSSALWRQYPKIVITLHASCGTVYCNRPCLFVCLFAGQLPRYREIVCIDPHQTEFVDKGSDRLQLITFWSSHALGKRVCGGAKIFRLHLTTASVQRLWLLSALFHS